MANPDPELAQNFNDQTPWQVTGEYEAREVLTVLNHTQKRPQGPVTVHSTALQPVMSLSHLLITLAKAGCDIKLHLEDSLWSRDTPETDCARLQDFLNSGFGKHLTVFYGYVKSATLCKMTSLHFLQLRLETAADVETFNSAQCPGEVVVGKNLRVDDNTPPLKPGTHLRFADAIDSDLIPWVVNVVQKLGPARMNQVIGQ